MSSRIRRIAPRALTVVFVLTVLLHIGLAVLGNIEGWSVEIDGFSLFFYLVLLLYLIIGLMIAARYPDNPIGLLLCALGPIWMTSELGDTLATLTIDGESLPGMAWGAWVGNWTWVPGMGIIGIYLLLLFPDGHLPSRRWAWVAWAGAIGMILTIVSTAMDPNRLTGGHVNPTALGGPFRDIMGIVGTLLFLATFLLAAASLFFRMKSSTGERRQQMKWLIYPASLLGPTLLLAAGSLFLGGNCEPDCPPNLEMIGAIGWFGALFVVLIAVPIAIGIAILKYRLYDIDVVINKTIVFGALAVFITGIYVAIVVGIGTLLGSQDEPNIALSIAATAIVAIAFSPVKERTQRVANRLVYGRRATPYEALSRFTEEVATSYETDKVAPAMAETIVSATGAERAEVWLALDHTLVRSAASPATDGTEVEAIRLDDGTVGDLPGTDVTAPVVHNGELLGALTLTKKRGEGAGPADRKLLDDLASQAGIVLRNSRLTAELRARLDQISATAEAIRESRQRIVAAQDKARRQLERDIHDGAQQHLVALAVKLNLAKTMARKKPERAQAMVAQLRDEAAEALETLDDLAKGIYPPVLAEHGIARAIRARADKAPFAVTVADETDDRYDTHTEAAVYFCILEALQNVAKYARATRATVTLEELDGELSFTVTDDGRGFDPATTDFGTGIEGMSDRLAAVGGTIDLVSAPAEGTTVFGRLPVRATTGVVA